MWFLDERRGARNRYSYRRLDNVRQSILMVSARATEQRQWQRRKIGTLLVVCVALAGTALAFKAGVDHVVAGLWVNNERFVLEHLIVRTDGRLRADQVRQYGGVREGMGLFRIRLSDLHQKLLSVPLIESVVLERRLPDTLVVDIRERIPIARLRVVSFPREMAIDHTGMVLPPSSQDVTLPVIGGVTVQTVRPGLQISDPSIRAALDLVKLCESPQYSRILRIAKVDVSSPAYMDVFFAQGERAMMPYEKCETKLKYACEIIKQAADMGQAVAAIDMTVDRNFPVKYR